MKKPKTKGDATFRRWLSAWSQSIQRLEVLEGTDPTNIAYQDLVVKGNMLCLNALLKDDVFTSLLATAYDQLSDKFGDDSAQSATRDFLMNACWICKPSLSSVGDTNGNTKPAPGDLKKEWLNLSKASIKLAKQIETLSPSFGPDSEPYLEARLKAGNPVGYIFNRKNPWRNAVRQPSTRRLSELLRCFAIDIEEEAALLGIAIGAHRQKGGAQAGLHFAMDALTGATIALSIDVPAQPNFALANRVITTLLTPSGGLDSSTIRRRYLAAKKRKTRA